LPPPLPPPPLPLVLLVLVQLPLLAWVLALGKLGKGLVLLG
jgi:hypothetical protein